ncbi:Heme A synthase [Sinobacterium norvegicum]|uniref:Heme A synthase n=1 Tax=Sinobacterium norvegicum TaxID=1641715 RepID=A0ABN8EKQ6_9GAMM|nr:COX15/CtaA family protein [Sinobacterium norvegicum]CAH0992988.1 Heme A synthase [Sinobacterium norvegicum]
MVEKNYNIAKKIVLLACVLTLFVIMLGAFTRLVDAGLGCPDWPGCYGHLTWPSTEQEVSRANQAFPDMPVEAGKPWPEMVHRYFASSLGLFAIFIAVFCYKAKSNNQQAPVKHAFFLLAFVILQGLFGMWTVTLKLWPQVVTGHLLGGFTSLTILWLLYLRINQRGWQVDQSVQAMLKKLKPLAAIALVVVITQVFLGGWTTSNYAAVACPDLPMCQGQWLPETNFENAFDFSQTVGPNYLGGALDNTARVTIHLSHRIGAVVTTVVLGLLIINLLRLRQEKTTRYGRCLAALLIIQIGLGLSNIIFHFPVSIAVAHNLFGALLLVSVAGLNYQLIKATKGA